jgi:glyoxylase-like metal-dependent hydrolase (beta-lactamase superfamily II)
MEIFKFVFSPIDVNTFILADKSGDCAIIDCGCYDASEFKILTNFIAEKKLNPVLLLNTHCHLDHIFGNILIQNKYNLGAFCSNLDEMNRKNSVQHAAMFGLEMDMPPEPAGYISDGEEVKFGSVILKALHVPGHSPGSLAFYSMKDEVVFTGDALFAGSIGRSDLPGGDHNTLIESIKRKLFTLPPSTVVYPGHGEETTIEREIKHNPFFN